MRFKRVDFPQPDFPNIPMNPDEGKIRLISFKAVIEF